mmetsp:Transcript_58884/g.117823  ORF Transcript_58884/g.117823 Transcript_58884/m.117823 type:complete len:229 (+) Transcript_58884:167-853(+)
MCKQDSTTARMHNRNVSQLRFHLGQVREHRLLFHHLRHGRHHHVLALQGAHVPSQSVVEALLHGVISGVVQKLLDAQHRDWALGGNLQSKLLGSLEHRVLALQDAGNETVLKGLVSQELPPRHRELTHQTLIANNLRKPLQATDISSHADVDLGRQEVGVPAAESDVARRDHLDAATDTGTVHAGDYGLATLLDVCEGLLPGLAGTPNVQRLVGHIFVIPKRHARRQV